jgi:hypothetical protein
MSPKEIPQKRQTLEIGTPILRLAVDPLAVIFPQLIQP